MTIRQTCVYMMMASGVLLFTGGIVQAEQSKGGTHAQSGKGNTSRNADGLTEGVKPSGKPKTAPEATRPDDSKTNPGKGSMGGDTSGSGSGSSGMGSSGGMESGGGTVSTGSSGNSGGGY